MSPLLIDGLIIVGYFVAITTIGLYLGRRENTLHDFALGGRRVPWWAVMASIIAAETSAATFLGAPGEGFDKLSLAYVQLVIGLIIGRVLVGYTFLGPYYRFKVYTVYDYLDVRFGPVSKAYVSGLFLIMRTLASGTRLFVPSLVIVLAARLFFAQGDGVAYSQSAVTSVWPYFWAIAALMTITCIYTALGGIKAVIWTDVVQACLMFTAACASIYTLLYYIGGHSWNPIDGFRAVGEYVPKMKTLEGYFRTGFETHTVEEWRKAHGVAAMGAWDYVRLIFESDYTLFSAVIASTLGNMAAFGTDQDMVQRMLTAETAKKARRSLITAAFMDVPIASAFTFIGVLLFVYFKQDPTHLPMKNGKPVNADVFGSFILNVMPVGLRGFVLAGVFATAMGSLSAALNALATSATNDWYLQRFRKKAGDVDVAGASVGSSAHTMSGVARAHERGLEAIAIGNRAVSAARWFTLLFAVLMVVIAVAFAAAKVADPDVRIIPIVLGIASFILGPMLGVFLLGLFTRNRGNDTGNLIAITIGLAVTTVLGGLHVDAANLFSKIVGSNASYIYPLWLPKISFTWFALVGSTVVVAVGVFFRTPESVIANAEVRAEQAQRDDRPMALRE